MNTDIALDAEVMQTPMTGVARSTLELYSACFALRPGLRATAIHRLDLKCDLPAGMESRCWRHTWSKKAWRRVGLPLYSAIERPRLFHFPWNGKVPLLFPGTVVITTYHDAIPLRLAAVTDWEKERYRRNAQRDLDRSDLVITVSETSKKDLMKDFRLSQEPVVIYHGISPPRVDGAARQDGEFFINVGGYDGRKGLDRLLRVYLRLFRENAITAPLLLIGAQNYFSEDFRADVERGVSVGAVVEKGYLPDAEVARLMSQAKGLIYPSLYEGFGFPPLEAMSCGCPVITSRVSSLPEVCGTAALYVDPEDDKALAKAIAEVDRNADLRIRLREEGLKQASKFTWPAAAGKFLAALDSLCNKRASHRPERVRHD